MDFDRRTLLVATSLLLTSACAKASGDAPKPPASGKGSGKGNNRTAMPAAASRLAPEDWKRFKAAFLHSDGRIVDTGNGGISHSEGQGYGMLLAETAADQEAFNSLFGWTEQVLARKDVALYSWRYVPKDAVPVADTNNATDGDILIAWALMRAYDRWHRPEYRDRAHQIRSAIRTRLVSAQDGRTLLLPALVGFTAPDRTTVNPSYYIWPALDLFARADGADGGWSALIADGERLAGEARFGPSRLPTDWVDVTSGGVAPAAGKPPRFGFDAVRVPLYQLMGGRRALTSDVAAYWSGFAGRGARIPAWVDVVTGEVAEYGLSEGGLAVVHRLVGAAGTGPPPGASRDYYSDVLALLTQI
ncbi:endoglucanase [Sphingosinicellaceae bacterium]|nr:endoglucanase [Sphingosinicellaceae bacterium]